MKITFSGDLGSGKSTVGKLLARKLDIPFFSTGALFRELGKVQNMDTLKFNLDAENNREIDAIIDGGIVELDKQHDDFILDSRMAWYFVKNSLKIYLMVNPEIAARRIMADGSRETEVYQTMDEACHSLIERRASEKKRYKSLYGVDISDLDNYDLSLDTGNIEIKEVLAQIEKRVFQDNKK